MQRNRAVFRAVAIAAVVADVALIYFGLTVVIPNQGYFGILWTVVLVLATVTAISRLVSRNR